MSDPHAKRTVADLIPRKPRLVPVGRLDRESEGLLLLTNDGDLAHRLQHPRYGVEKEYLVEVLGHVPDRISGRLLGGIHLDDGVARAVRVGEVRRVAGRSSVRLVMNEGRKREIRRMFEALGFHVRRLVRTRVGPVRLGVLRPGSTRPLTPEEVSALYGATGLRRARPAG